MESRLHIIESQHLISAIQVRKLAYVSQHISKEARASFNQPVEEIDIEIPYGDFTSFLNVNPIERGYLWLKENVIGFEDAVDDFDVLEPIIEPVVEDELDPNQN